MRTFLINHRYCGICFHSKRIQNGITDTVRIIIEIIYNEIIV